MHQPKRFQRKKKEKKKRENHRKNAKGYNLPALYVSSGVVPIILHDWHKQRTWREREREGAMQSRKTQKEDWHSIERETLEGVWRDVDSASLEALPLLPHHLWCSKSLLFQLPLVIPFFSFLLCLCLCLSERKKERERETAFFFQEIVM